MSAVLPADAEEFETVASDEHWEGSLDGSRCEEQRVSESDVLPSEVRDFAAEQGGDDVHDLTEAAHAGGGRRVGPARHRPFGGSVASANAEDHAPVGYDVDCRGAAGEFERVANAGVEYVRAEFDRRGHAGRSRQRGER
jgi:hypothetical protein